MELDDVQDPSDFPIAAFRRLDGSLRCPICKEFFDGPVNLQCGHTFCSLCVRNVLPRKPECPKCCAPAKEIHLARNTMLEEAAMAWSDARALALQLARESIGPRPNPSTGSKRGTKRKLSQQLSGPDAGPSNPFRRESSTSRGAPLGEEEDDLDADGENVTAPERITPIVQCPVCNCDVPRRSINQHIDSDCKKFLSVDSSITRETGNSKPKATWDSIFAAPGRKPNSSARDSEISVKKLAKVSYGTLKISQLREMLKDIGLSTTGERQELILRHERWIAINNANLDRGKPKPMSELKQQLKQLEEVTSRPGPKKVQDEKAYARMNKAQFASLVESARPTATDSTGEATPAANSAPPSSGPLTTVKTSSPPSAPEPLDVIVID